MAPRKGSRASLGSAWGWALTLLALFALRFVWLDQDPLLVSPSGLYLTDEGWYTKAAQNLLRWGQADAAQDFVPITHTWGYTWLSLQIFRVFGIALYPLRAFGVLVCAASTGVLAWSLHQQWSPRAARMLSLALGCNLLLISLSRFAIPDSLAFGVLTFLLAALVRRETYPVLDWVAALLSVAAVLLKLSYLPVTLWTATLLAFLHGQSYLNTRRSSTFARGIVLSVTPLVLTGTAYFLIHRAYPQAWAMFSDLNLRDRFVGGPGEWMANIFYAIGADLWSTGAMGWIIFLILRARQSNALHWRQAPVLALLVLAGLNFAARSFIWYHPPRYGLLTYLVLALLSIYAAQPNALSQKIPRSWIVCFMAGQLPQLIALCLNGYSGDSMQRSAKAMIQLMQRSAPEPTHIYGTGTASYFSLFAPQYRAVDISDERSTMCARLKVYGDGFLVVDTRKAQDFSILSIIPSCGSGLELTKIDEKIVLNNYYHQGPWTLYHLSGTRSPAQQ